MPSAWSKLIDEPLPDLPWVVAMIDAYAVPTVIVREDGVIELVNKAWQEAADSMEGSSLRCGPGANYFAECERSLRRGCEDARAFLAGCIAVVGGKVDRFAFPYECQRPDGRIDWFKANVIRLQVESTTRLLITHADISHPRKVERELAKSTDWLGLAFEAGKIGAWEWDLKAGRITWSTQFAIICGYVPGVFGGTYESYVERVHPDDRDLLEDAVASAQRLGGIFQHEHRIVQIAGPTRWVRGAGRFLTDVHGTPVRMVGVLQDISSQRLAAEHEAARQRLSAAAELSSAVAHEFNSILLAASATLFGITADAATQSKVKTVAGLLQQAQDLTSSMRDAFPHSLTGGEESVRVRQWIGPMIDTLRSGWPEGVRVRVEEIDDRLRCEVAPVALKQILRLILANAVEAMMGKGEIRIEAEEIAHVAPQRRICAIRVRDDGPGIPSHLSTRIFEPLVTTHREQPGRGLGLSIANRLVREYGGTIGHEAVQPHGACFTVNLPCKAADSV